MKRKLAPLLFLAALLPWVAATEAASLGTAISYQGRLDDAGAPASGTYSFRYRLLADPAGTTQIGPVVDLPSQPVNGGLLNASLDFGASAFNGDARWLEISVKAGGPGAAGDYIKLNPQPLPPAGSSQFARLAGDVLNGTITSAKLAPLAITTTHISDGAITAAKLGPASITSGNVADNAITAPKIANAQVVKSLNGLRDTVTLAAGANVVLATNGNTLTVSATGSGGGGGWSLTGNATAPGQFIGTLGNLPFEVQVNGVRAARLEPTLGGPNVVLGRSNNSVSTSVVAGTIGGGEGHLVAGNHSTVAGGNANSCGSNAAFVGGGTLNHANGSSSTLAGGYDNTASGSVSFIGGGARNRSSSIFSVVAGGEFNESAAEYASLLGGNQNFSYGAYSTIGGGNGNGAGMNAFVGGGFRNNAEGVNATIPGGADNYAGGAYSFAAGWGAQARHDGSFVWADAQPAGPIGPMTFESTGVNQFCIRASGGVRINRDTSIHFGAQTRQMLNLWGAEYGIGVQGGNMYFRADGNYEGTGFAWHRGGSHSDAHNNPGAGGATLMTLDPSTGLEVRGDIKANDITASETVKAFSVEGVQLVAQRLYLNAGSIGEYVTIGGGGLGRFSLTIGAQGGVIIHTGPPGEPQRGVMVPAGGGSWETVSDRNSKEQFADLDPKTILRKVAALPIQSWQYKSEKARSRHVGPTAQDFHAAFGFGTDDTHIATVDADGVALAAIQGLHQIAQEQQTAMGTREAENIALKEKLAALQEQLTTHQQMLTRWESRFAAMEEALARSTGSQASPAPASGEVNQ
jgi:hypothetical protein